MSNLRICHLFACTALAALTCATAAAQGIDPGKLPGLAVDDEAAEVAGQWQKSTSVKPFVGASYRYSTDSAASARFRVDIPADARGKLHVLLSYTPHGNRTSKAQVTIESSDGIKTVYVDQQKRPSGPYNFHALGEFTFDEPATIVIEPGDSDGCVIADAVLLVSGDQLKQLNLDAAKMPLFAKKVAKTDDKKQADKEPPLPPAPKFARQPPSRDLATLTTEDIDAVLEKHLESPADAPPAGDQQFLRRATLDLIGRQPTLDELAAFDSDTAADKRSRAIERLLAGDEYGANWANFWSDVMAYRQQEPQLTFHNYDPFESWLAGQLNTDRRWDEIVFSMLTARGKVGENPQGTFIAFHQADEKKLAGETSRVFLSIQIACAECHDHPFIDMPQETFHGMAAYFVRTEAKIPWNDSSEIELVSKPKGEHKMPGGKEEMRPVALTSASIDLGVQDLDRRAALANWIVAGDNPYFARSYVNHVWARLMGRGFFDPVDDMGEGAVADLPELHNALADHFVATGFDTRSIFRLVMNSRAYQRQLSPDESGDKPFAAAVAKKLRGDEVFDSLVTAIGLPNVQPPLAKPTGAFRFPVPPKSTRDLVDEAFGYDPSFRDGQIVRTMKQAMFMMNNVQLQRQIDASPESETYLAKLLAAQEDDAKVVAILFRAVLARDPNEREQKLALAHVEQVTGRGAAFEDLLWSLINSAEFTTRR